jgi:hypothetical protein
VRVPCFCLGSAEVSMIMMHSQRKRDRVGSLSQAKAYKLGAA